MPTTLHNWMGTVRFTPAVIAAPCDEAEIASLVRDSTGPLRVGGARHSWSPLIATDATYLSLDNLASVLEVDAERGLVRVQAGIRLHALNTALAAAGLALPVLGSITQQSIAGATSTGTHGSSMTWGGLHTLVVGMRFVDGRGEIVALGQGDPDLPGARLALGALGVLTELTLKVIPAFRLVEELELLPFEEAAASVEEIARSAEWCKLWWLPHTDRVLVFRYHRVGPATDAPERTSLARWVDQTLVNACGFEAILRLGALLPALVPRISRLVLPLAFHPWRRAGRSDQMLSIAMPPKNFETESAIPLSVAGALLSNLRAGIGRERLAVNFMQELRFGPADDTWLGGAHGRDTCHFGAYISGAWAGDTRMRDRYYRLFWDLVRPHDPRPHWGKELEDPRGLLRRYPRGEDFRRLVAKHDPLVRFQNELLKKILN